MLMHSTQFPPPVVPGAEYYRFIRDGESPKLFTLSGRTPKDPKRSGATYEDVIKARRDGYDGIAAYQGNGTTQYWDYPSDANLTAQTAPPPRVAMVSGFGSGHTNEADPSKPGKPLKPYVAIDLAGIRALVDMPQQVGKADAQWLIPSTLQTRTFKRQEAEGKFWMLWADFDTDPQPVERVAQVVEQLTGGSDFEVYNSRGATVERPKSRALIPLANPLAGADWTMCQEVLNDMLESQGLATDRASERSAQLCYLPNRGTFYETRSQRDGVLFDPLTHWAGAIAAKRKAIADADTELNARKAEAQTRKSALAAASGTQGRSPIDAFNECFTVQDILVRNGYAQRGNSFRHPNSQSGSYSAGLKNGRVHALSSSDPLYSHGQGAHDAFSAFKVLEHGCDHDAALKDAGDNWLTIGSEAWNKVKRREYAQQKAAQEQAGVDISGILRQQSKATGDANWAVNDSSATGEPTLTPVQVLAEGQSKGAHPLSLKNAIQLKDTPEAVNFVVDDFIQEGVVFIAGQQGVGKTSALLPLAMAQGGLHEQGYQFAPKKPNRWRHIIYLTEDAAQVNRIIAAMVTRGCFNLEKAQQRIHVIPAVAMGADLFVKVRDEYATLFADESGVQLPPLVVADTRSACFAVESENDNAEMSKLVAELKQNFAGLPIWVVAHLSKETATRSNAATLSVRGAGAAEGDAHQVLFLVREQDSSRWLVRGKTRFESPWQELSLRSEMVSVLARDRWGEVVSMNVRWSLAEAPAHDRAEIKERAKSEAEKNEMADLRDEIRNAVQEAWNLGHPLNKQGVKAKVKRKASTVLMAIESLLAEGWLYEVSVPTRDRTHPSRSAFLVNLTTLQHESFRADCVLPDELLTIPQSWRKPSNSPVPVESSGAVESAAI